MLALSPRNDPGAVIGKVGVQARGAAVSGASDLVLGYWLGKTQSGQGLRQAAIEGVLDMAFMLPDAQSIEAPVCEDNVAARKALARCGFPQPMPDARQVMVTRTAWLAARADAPNRIASSLASHVARRIALPQAATV